MPASVREPDLMVASSPIDEVRDSDFECPCGELKASRASCELRRAGACVLCLFRKVLSHRLKGECFGEVPVSDESPASWEVTTSSSSGGNGINASSPSPLVASGSASTVSSASWKDCSEDEDENQSPKSKRSAGERLGGTLQRSQHMQVRTDRSYSTSDIPPSTNSLSSIRLVDQSSRAAHSSNSSEKVDEEDRRSARW